MDIDVALLALVYLAIGFYSKNIISKWLISEDRKLDIITVFVTVLLICFCVYNYWDGRRLYNFDMKILQYKSYVLAVIIPCSFGIILLRISYWIGRIRILTLLEKVLSYVGEMTLPIMFIHMPLNHWKYQGYGGSLIYVLVGICGPIIFTLIFNRFKIMRKFFGLPIVTITRREK